MCEESLTPYEKMRTGLAFVVATLLAPSIVLAQSDTKGETAVKPEGPLPPWQEVLDALMNLNVGNIALWRLALAAFLIILGIALRKFLLQKLLGPVQALLEKTETDYDDQLLEAVEHPLRWLVNLIAIYFALLVLSLPSALMSVASLILQTIGTVMVAWMLNKLVDVFVAVLMDFTKGTKSEVDDYLVPVVGRVIRVGLFALVFIVIVQQWGYDVTSLLAGLGLGGLAFALAAKQTLSNWFGSLMIFTDRPFTLGDRIDIDAGNGVVEEVGLRSTRIRTREDSVITIPNSNMAAKPIENLSARRRRRIETTLGLVYGTTFDQVREIAEEIRALFAEHPEVSEEASIVRFTNFGSSALEIYIDCYAKPASRPDYFRVREEVHYGIAEIVEEAGSSIAFPSRSLYLETPVELEEEPGE